MSVFVLDKRKRPLMPCSEKRARKLLEAGRAVVKTADALIQGVSHRHCRLLQRGDGHEYLVKEKST